MIKTLVLMGLLLLAGCLNTSQRAKDIFFSSNMPTSLEKISNPIPPDEARAYTSSSASSPSRLQVAVIDNGVDYLHPDLLPQIALTVVDNKIVGVGKDFLGQDDWAYPSLIDASLYAFGAQGIRETRIEGPLEDPLSLLLEMNRIFVQQLQEAILASDELKATLFNKINLSSINLAGALLLLEDQDTCDESKGSTLDPATLFTLDTKSKPDFIKKYQIPSGLLRAIIDLPWEFDKNSGLPLFYQAVYYSPDSNNGNRFSNICYLEHFDAFYALVKQVYEDFNHQHHFKQLLAPYLKYQSARSAQNDDNNKVQTLQKLSAIIYYQLNPNSKDELRNLVSNYCFWQSDADYYNPKWEVVDSSFNNFFTYLKGVDNYIIEQLSDPEANDERDDGANILRLKESSLHNSDNMPKIRDLFFQYANTRGKELFLCSKATPSTAWNAGRFNAGYIQATTNSNHPYKSSKDKGEIHGTHVAGIIANQSKQLEIVPVRVITASTEREAEQSKVVNEYIWTAMKAWTQKPMVFCAILDLFTGHIKVLEDIQNNPAKCAALATTNPEAFTRLHTQLMNFLSPLFAKSMTSDPLDYHFFHELVAAIKYVGERKIKISNISLGTSFSEAPASIDQNELRKNLKKSYTFFKYEFFKYFIASTIATSASNSLFVVAAGNDGTWLDGKTKSALPCDLTTTYLEKYLRYFPEEKLPGELKNILCVGSIGPKEDLSAFSNITLTKIPFVFSFGESILSTIKSNNCDGIEQDFTVNLGDDPAYTSGHGEAWFQKLLESKGILTATMTLEERKQTLEAENFKYQQFASNISSILTNLKTHECIFSNKTSKARLSGTSMASPAVAGYIAAVIQKKMAEEALTQEEIYNHPNYTPTKIIEEIWKLAPVFGGNTLLREVHKITAIKEHNDHFTLMKRMPGTNKFAILQIN
ncbi:MAG: S8 family serine peptidase [Oligoflexia bacterium]|nr:S8 family serine peptidase [Oligoflexia bacterium]